MDRGAEQAVPGVVPRRSRGPRTFHAVQRYPAFRYLWISNLLFFGGVWTQTLVLGWLVFDITRSEFLLAVFTAARLGPMLLGPLGGVLADRIHRVRFLLWAQIFTLAVVAVAAALTSLHLIRYWHILVLGFLLGATQAPVQPTRFTLITELVDRGDLSNANALNTVALTGTGVIGPAIGGGLIRALGPGMALWFSASWYILAALALIPLLRSQHGRSTSPASGLRVFAEIADGFRIALGDRHMASVVFVSFAANVCAWPVYQAFMPVFAREVLNVGPGGLGALLSAAGAGSLLGSLLIASLGDFPRKGLYFIAATGLFGLFFALFALQRDFAVALPIMVLIGLASSGFGVLQSTLLLLLAPEDARGRVMGIQVLAIGILPVATLVQGVSANFIGVPATTVVAGGLLALSMVGLGVAVPSLRGLR